MAEKKNNNLIWIGLGVIVIVVGILMFSGKQNKVDTIIIPNDTVIAPVNTVKPTSIEIRNSQFIPAELDIKVGEKAVWTNFDTITHQVFIEGIGSTSARMGKGEGFSFTFGKAGIYKYHCTYHPTEQGFVVVE